MSLTTLPSSAFQPALPMRGVTRPPDRQREDRLISTRTPHAGSDFFAPTASMTATKFQPALPMRGVTGRLPDPRRAEAISTRTPHAGSDAEPLVGDHEVGISTRTPHAGSDVGHQGGLVGRMISTRTPHAGSDRENGLKVDTQNKFQPALPMRGVTSARRPAWAAAWNFNPHSPCGE